MLASFTLLKQTLGFSFPTHTAGISHHPSLNPPASFAPSEILAELFLTSSSFSLSSKSCIRPSRLPNPLSAPLSFFFFHITHQSLHLPQRVLSLCPLMDSFSFSDASIPLASIYTKERCRTMKLTLKERLIINEELCI